MYQKPNVTIVLCNKQPQKPLWQLVKCQGLTGESGRQLLWSWRSFFSLLGDGWRLLDCVGWPQQWSGGWAWGVSALFCMFLILQKTSSGMSLWSNRRNLQELLRPRLKTGTCHFCLIWLANANYMRWKNMHFLYEKSSKVIDKLHE